MVELEEKVLDLTKALAIERARVADADERASKAELMAQHSAQAATACELRVIESQREATLRNKALFDAEQTLAYEKERNIVMSAQHAAESASVRRLQAELRSPPTFASPKTWVSPLTHNLPSYHHVPAASIRSLSKASVSLS
eukprot:TRINITY_DN40595_c0_g1_i1.p1 TRINITY_DN40595_c0_g1~~TRINITY_DN40595_c0_g1_i1.p1  ORF type:complete len:152 (+),score=28.80 TRINITY_DN40595_c0_g1_i1:32-457(+)